MNGYGNHVHRLNFKILGFKSRIIAGRSRELFVHERGELSIFKGLMGRKKTAECEDLKIAVSWRRPKSTGSRILLERIALLRNMEVIWKEERY